MSMIPNLCDLCREAFDDLSFDERRVVDDGRALDILRNEPNDVLASEFMRDFGADVPDHVCENTELDERETARCACACTRQNSRV